MALRFAKYWTFSPWNADIVLSSSVLPFLDSQTVVWGLLGPSKCGECNLAEVDYQLSICRMPQGLIKEAGLICPRSAKIARVISFPSSDLQNGTLVARSTSPCSEVHMYLIWEGKYQLVLAVGALPLPSIVSELELLNNRDAPVQFNPDFCKLLVDQFRSFNKSVSVEGKRHQNTYEG